MKKCQLLSHVPLFATAQIVAHQAPRFMKFSRQDYWNGLPFPSPGDLSDQRIELRSLALQADSLPSEPRFSFFQGLPRWHSGKEPTFQCTRRNRHRFDPQVWKVPQRRNWQPTPVFSPGESHGQRNLAGYSPRGCRRVPCNLTTEHGKGQKKNKIQDSYGHCNFNKTCAN